MNIKWPHCYEKSRDFYNISEQNKKTISGVTSVLPNVYTKFQLINPFLKYLQHSNWVNNTKKVLNLFLSA